MNPKTILAILFTAAVLGGCSGRSENPLAVQDRVGVQQAAAIAASGRTVSSDKYMKVFKKVPPGLRRQFFRTNVRSFGRLSATDKAEVKRLLGTAN